MICKERWVGTLVAALQLTEKAEQPLALATTAKMAKITRLQLSELSEEYAERSKNWNEWSFLVMAKCRR